MNNELLNACLNAAMIAKVYDSKNEGKKITATNAVNEMLKVSSNTIDHVYDMSFLEFAESNANEAMSTGQVGFGKEFIALEILDTMLKERMEDSKSLFSMITVKRMAGKNVKIPVRGAKRRMVGGGENADVPVTGLAAQRKKGRTAELELIAKKLKLTIYFTDDLAEDSVVEMGRYVLEELSAAFDTSMHEVLINGDTTIGNLVNINIIDGNTTGATSEEVPDGDISDVIVINNGIRKLAFDKGAIVNAGVLDLTDIRAARKTMGLKGIDPSQIKLVPGTDVYTNLLGLTQAETVEKFGTAATVLNGVIVAIDGMEIITRQEMRKALASGKNSVTANLNVTGSMGLIHIPSTTIGVRRVFKTEADRDIEAEQTLVTGSSRVDVIFDDTQNSTGPTSPVALIYNITL